MDLPYIIILQRLPRRFRHSLLRACKSRWSLIALGYMLVIVAAAEPTDVKA